MSELHVCMDPLNPGHFFACCGLLELISLEVPGTLSRFVLNSFRPRVAEFVLDPGESVVHLKDVLGRLRMVKPEFPDQRNQSAVWPAVIRYGSNDLVLDWWLDEFRLETENLKCWAGQVTTRNLFSELLPLLDEESTGEDLFSRPRLTKAKFGVDPRSAWNARDFGFSPNEHGRDSATYPAVEILAAIGLRSFRPKAERRQGVAYGLWEDALPVIVARVAFRAPWQGLRCRRFEFSIAKRGQSYKYFTFAVEAKKENAPS